MSTDIEITNIEIKDTQMQALDPLLLPLTGRRLIEASAGTGKTYTISGLYLRLLLGDSQAEPLTCEQILVVTFTNAATEELRDRIRRRIKTCYQRFIGLDVKDDFVNSLYEAMPDSNRHIALKRLDLALKSLDEAAIFTIHGFCQRILSDMAFESALLFESEFTLDDSQYLQQSVRDYWRYACYHLPEYLASAIAAEFTTPNELGRQIRPLLGASQAKANKIPMAYDKVCEQLTVQVSRLKMAWPQGRDELEQLLHSLPLNGTSYGKKEDGFPKLTLMLQRMDNWAKYQQGLPEPKLLGSLSLSNIKLRKNGVIPTAQEAPLLAQIESLNESLKNLIPAFLYLAKEDINQRFLSLKAERNLLSPDDLLLTLAKTIGFMAGEQEDVDTSANMVSEQLKASIAKRFPVALIDEFQDTDPLQYAIFSGIYPVSTDTEADNTLLMIGDPKQAIYAFRGADIFTYISARNDTEHRYNLDTNYRSSQQMITGVNKLFGQQPHPFISDSIPFEAVDSADKGNKLLQESKLGQELDSDKSALKIRLLPENREKGLNKTTARKLLAADAAEEIARLLNAAIDGNCQLTDKQKPLKARDIAVLVRDRNEAGIMQQALTERKIGAVFLSRDSVLATDEANEMVRVLRALANPRDERAIRSALACRLLGFDGQKIHQFNQSEDLRSQVLEQFMQLHQHWKKRGIMPALMQLANKYQLMQRLASEANAERRLTDFRHLAELLQQKSAELDGITALLGWFEQELMRHGSTEEQQLRLASEQNLVQIVTIHKSKGLEYPVCFLPFVSLARDNSRRPSPMLYHENEQLIWDLDATDDGWEVYKQEVLAEDLRLLYVAITRPIYRCYLYIANQSRVSSKGINSFLKETAIGYLLGITNKECTKEVMTQAAEKLKSPAISVSTITENTDFTLLKQSDSHDNIKFHALEPIHRGGAPWRVGSYSGLVKHLSHENINPGSGDEDLSDEIKIIDKPETFVANRFSFERGANAGSFMHLVMEEIDFTQADVSLAEHLPSAMAKYGIDEDWQAVLHHWYQDLLSAPIRLQDDTLISLSELHHHQKLVEMEFYLQLGQITQDDDHQTRLSDIALSRLLARYGYAGELKFDAFKGMLKGFIDLTFEYNGKFYIADYKSNHLGDDFEDYNQINMAAAISSHRYDLQYIIYTLALHRYLSIKLENYSYQKHFGGCVYLFLRGMSASHPDSGVFFDKPDESLIIALDALFKGEEQQESLV